MSKNTLNQLTPEQQQTVVSWIEDDPHRKPGQPTSITRVRNQFNIETTPEELADFRFNWHFQIARSAENRKPENQKKLLNALLALGKDDDRLQQAALSQLLVRAIDSDDNKLLLQVVKLNQKRVELELKKILLNNHLQKIPTELLNSKLPNSLTPPVPPIPPTPGSPGSPLVGPLPLNSSPLATQPLSSTLALSLQPSALSFRTHGPQSVAAGAEIAQSILDEARKAVKSR